MEIRNLFKKKTKKQFSSQHHAIPLTFDAGGEGEIPIWIQVLPIGTYEHAYYGTQKFEKADLEEMVNNFNKKIGKNAAYITLGHEGFMEQPAAGWFAELEVRGDGLWGRVDWTNIGIEAIENKHFKFVSAEIYPEYRLQLTGEIVKNIFGGAALTKDPYFVNMEQAVYSAKFNAELEDNVDEDMNSKKESTEIEPKEGEVEEDVTETEVVEEVEAKVDTEDTQTEEAVEGDDGSAEKQELSAKAGEKVTLSAAEFASLQESQRQLNESKLNSFCADLILSKSNEKGKFSSNSTDKLKAFVQTLSDEQKESFKVLMSEVPVNISFSEIGDGGTTVSVKEKYSSLVTEKVNRGIDYSLAVKQVVAENNDIKEAYESGGLN